jgi:hypothetical protein
MLCSACALPTSSVGPPRLTCKSPWTRYHRQHTIDRHVLTCDCRAARPYHPLHARRGRRVRRQEAKQVRRGEFAKGDQTKTSAPLYSLSIRSNSGPGPAVTSRKPSPWESTPGARRFSRPRYRRPAIPTVDGEAVVCGGIWLRFEPVRLPVRLMGREQGRRIMHPRRYRSARLAIVALMLLAASSAFAESLTPKAARNFVAGKLFAFSCFDGSRGSGRIYGDGSVVGTIQARNAATARMVSLPAGTLRVRGNAVCASLQSMPFEPCFHIEKTDDRSFRGSLSGLGFAYCDFTRVTAQAAG